MPAVVGFVKGIAWGLGLGGAATGAGLAGFAVGASVGAFLGGTVLGSLLVNVGLTALLTQRPGRASNDVESSRVNSRVSNPERFQLMGNVAAGGSAGHFGEHDADGNFWYIVAHGDAMLTGDPSYILDGIAVTLSDGTDGFTAGDVLTDDFCLTSEYAQYEGTGTRVPYFRIYTVTPDQSNDYGALPSDFSAAFPNLPSDFYNVGVCYSIVRCKAIPPEHYRLAYRWRGAFQIGEPSVTLVGNFGYMYDPRNVAHDIEDPTTWTASNGNSAIIWAYWRTHEFGRNRAMSKVNWDKVAESANICDETVNNRSGDPVPLYRCGLAASDETERSAVEKEILLTCDGFVAHDDQGRAYPVVGHYEEPAYTFTAERDIITAQTEVIDDGESPLDGVVVNYISPDHNYTKQPAAAWVNNQYYDAGAKPNYRFVDVAGCQDHNQAVRLAKAMGQRAAPSKKAALGCSLKGQLVASERSINLSYDAEFTGVFEIASPVKEDNGGAATAFAVIPLAPDRWRLNEGEEGAPPALTPALNVDDSISSPQNVVITSQSITTETGSAVRLYATFDEPSRLDRFFRFRYTLNGGSVYEYFTVDMDEGFAYSAIVKDGADYDVQYATYTAGGRTSDWSAIVDITATANPTAPTSLASAGATGGVSVVDFTYETANDVNQYAVSFYRGATNVFASATKVGAKVASANVTGAFNETGVAAGSYYCWAVPSNGSGVEGAESGPYAVTVT